MEVIRRDVRLAQLDRAFGYGPKGRGFESSNAQRQPCGSKAFSISADVVKLADAQDLGSCAARRAGSSPAIRRIHLQENRRGKQAWQAIIKKR